MKILIAEYAVATGLPGTYQVEGTAMLSILAASFLRLGHEVIYPTAGPKMEFGSPIFMKDEVDFGKVLAGTDAGAGLVIAPDELLPQFLELLEGPTANLGCSPEVTRICADKLESTLKLEEAGVPVVEVIDPSDPGEGPYVLKPRFGCGSDRIDLVQELPKLGNDDRVATRYHEGEHLSASLVCSGDRVLPLTINKQQVLAKSGFQYEGGQVPYRSPREEEILTVAKMAAEVLGLRGYVGIDFVVGDIPRVVDVNPRPTTSIVGITKVMKEELADLILRAKFSSLPDKVTVEGEWRFRKDELGSS